MTKGTTRYTVFEVRACVEHKDYHGEGFTESFDTDEEAINSQSKLHCPSGTVSPIFWSVFGRLLEDGEGAGWDCIGDFGSRSGATEVKDILQRSIGP